MCSPSRTPTHLSPHPIPQGYPSALALSTLFHASNLDQRATSHMIIYINIQFYVKYSDKNIYVKYANIKYAEYNVSQITKILLQ